MQFSTLGVAALAGVLAAGLPENLHLPRRLQADQQTRGIGTELADDPRMASDKTHPPDDAYIATVAGVLGIPLAPAWIPAIRMNLDTTLALAALVEDVRLPDEAEPAPVFRP